MMTRKYITAGHEMNSKSYEDKEIDELLRKDREWRNAMDLLKEPLESETWLEFKKQN